VNVEELWQPDRAAEAQAILKTTSKVHPGAAGLLAGGPHFTPGTSGCGSGIIAKLILRLRCLAFNRNSHVGDRTASQPFIHRASLVREM